MNIVKSIWLIVIPIILLGCGPSRNVFSDYDREVSFSEFRFYTWAPLEKIEAERNPMYYNELMDKRIRDAVDLQMKGKNYKLVNEGADLIIHYHIIIEDEMMINADPYGFYGPYWTRSNINVVQYSKGTLIIDLMDSESRNLLWRGWAVDAFDLSVPEKTEVQVRESIMRIFEKYPFKAPEVE